MGNCQCGEVVNWKIRENTQLNWISLYSTRIWIPKLELLFMIFSTVRITTWEHKKWFISSPWLEFPDALIKKRLILWHFYIHLYKIKYIYYNNFWKCLNWRLAPKLYQQLLEFNFGRLAYDLWMCYCFGNLCCHNNYYSYSSALLSKR